MTITKIIKIDVEADQANKELERFDDNLQDTTESTEGLTNSLDSMTGGAVSGFTKVLGTVKKTIIGFKSLKVAIAATGIGLLVVAIGALYTAFKSSEEGQNRFTKLMGQIGVVTGNVIDIFANLGESLLAIGKALTRLAKGDIQGAKEAWGEFKTEIKEVTDGVKNFASETKKEFAIANEIADKRAEATRLQRELIIDIAKAERDVAELRDKAARKDLYDANQRKAFLEEAAAINDRIIDQQIEAARLTAEAIAAENELSKSTIEDKELQAQAEAELIRLETERFNKRKELGAELSAINQQELAEKEALIEAEKKQQEEELKSRKELNEKLLAADKEKNDKKLQADLEARQKKAEADAKAARDDIELSKMVEDSKLELFNTTSNLIKAVAGKDSKVAKGVAAVQATWNTYNGITSALSAPSVLPEPFAQVQRLANAATVGVMGFKNVKNILATDTAKSGGGSTGSSSRRATVPRFNLVQGTGTNQIAEGLNKEAPIAKAYVVGSDVTTSQELDRKIVQGASL